MCRTAGQHNRSGVRKPTFVNTSRLSSSASGGQDRGPSHRRPAWRASGVPDEMRSRGRFGGVIVDRTGNLVELPVGPVTDVQWIRLSVSQRGADSQSAVPAARWRATLNRLDVRYMMATKTLGIAAAIAAIPDDVWIDIDYTCDDHVEVAFEQGVGG